MRYTLKSLKCHYHGANNPYISKQPTMPLQWVVTKKGETMDLRGVITTGFANELCYI